MVNESDDPVALHSQGMIAYHNGRCEEAVSLINKAIEKNPQIPQFHCSIGIVLKALGMLQEAIGAYKQALALKPDYIEVYYNLANLLHEQGQSSEAIDNYKQAIKIKPDFFQAYSNLGIVLKDCNRIDEAIENFEQAIKLNPNAAEVYYNLANVLKDSGKNKEAIENYKQAIGINSDYAEAYCNLGLAYKETGRYDDAIENYELAIRLKPDFVQAHWNRSLVLLVKGDFAQGFEEYQWRRNTELKVTAYPNRDKMPSWDGSSFVGKRLFIHYEQGFGDNLQFVRYLPMVKERGGTVIYEAKKPLIELLRNFDGIDELVEAAFDGRPAQKFDYHLPLLSLPKIFNTTLETIPANVPYLSADPEKTEYWRQYLHRDDAFKIGIVWAGKASHGNDANRSCSLQNFIPLTEIDGIQLYGLQKDHAEDQAKEMQVTNFGEQFENFADTAAMIENLDLVISVDTAVAHLAGAMAKPVWVILPFVPEWRWMLDRQDNPWYPTMTLFRQQKQGDWNDLFHRLKEQLKMLVENQIIVSS